MSILKPFAIFVFVFLGFSGWALAAEDFNGKWYFEDELLLQILPPGYAEAENGARLEELKEQFFNNTFMLIDVGAGKLEIFVCGEEPEADYFEIVEYRPGILRIKPLDDPQVTILTIMDDGRLEMKTESSDYAMYFLREREKQGNKQT